MEHSLLFFDTSSSLASAYKQRVSFNFLDNDLDYHSIVLNRSSHGYIRTARTRTFMVAMDINKKTTNHCIKFTIQV